MQNDYRLDSASEAVAKFPSDRYKLRKGFKRVSIHSDEEHVNTIMEEEEKVRTPSQTTSFWNFEQRRKYAKSFDIVLHQGEAYLIGLNLNTKISGGDNSFDIIEGSVVDYSNAWQHELLLVN